MSIKESLIILLIPLAIIPLLFGYIVFKTFPVYDFAFLAAFVVVFFVVLVVVVSISDYVSKSFKKVIEFALSISEGDIKCKFELESSIRDINMMANALEVMKLRTVENYQLKIMQSTYQTIERISRQVSHDIRSPLVALDVAIDDADDIPEEKRVMIRGAVERIKDIVNDLNLRDCESHKASQNKEDVFLLSGIVESLVSEKRLQYSSKRNISIQSSRLSTSYGIFSRVDHVNLKRVLSNLINNSVEAIEGAGKISIDLWSSNNKVFIKVSDSGKGISSDVLPKVMKRGVTCNKENGAGLGLHHAKSTIEGFGGSISIESVEGVGTDVLVVLPKHEPPKWFLPELIVDHDCKVVILDDDASIHQVWKSRFSHFDVSQEILYHFSECQDLIDWYLQRQSNDKSCKIIFLCDYELIGQHMTGLDVIEDLGIAKQSILVTSRYEEEDVKARCEKLGVRLIPKNLAGFVPINIKSQKSTDYVLIDDEKLNHLTWKVMAKKHNVKLETYFHPDEFFAHSDEFSKKTKIYIDSDLRIAIRGEEVAKEIKNKGFEHIYLATGSLPSRFGEMPWIEKIVDKKPPFKSEL